MPLSSAHAAFTWARHHNRSLAAFNVITLEHAEAIIGAAEKVDLPVTLQVSENAVAHHGSVYPLAAALRELGARAHVPVTLHLDHITTEDLAHTAPDIGFHSVMFDASTNDYPTNVARTSAFVAFAAPRGIWVESELGEIGGKDGAHAPGVHTPPADAARYVTDTGVDSLAVAVGSSHAMETQTASLDIDLIAQIAEAVDVPLVLHGSSGVPDDLIVAACRAGMTKINIGTALNIAFTSAASEALAEGGSSDPRKYLGPARNATQDVVFHYLSLISGPRPTR